MLLSIRAARRGMIAAIGAGVVTGGMLAASVPALADPPPPPAPGCSVGDLEQVKSSVAAATSVYMFTHPDVNAFFSSLKGQPKDQAKTQIDDYFAANPQTQAELAGIRAPMRDMKARCQ